MRRLILAFSVLLLLLVQTPVKAQDPQYTGWATNGVFNCLPCAAGTIIARTPPLGLGAHRVSFFVGATVATFAIEFQRLNVSGVAVAPYTQRIPIASSSPFVSPPGLPIFCDDQETFALVIVTALATGSVQGSVFYE